MIASYYREVSRERILDNKNKALKVQEKQIAMADKVRLQRLCQIQDVFVRHGTLWPKRRRPPWLDLVALSTG